MLYCMEPGFTETWLNEAILDNALHLPGFQPFRADHIVVNGENKRW